MLKHTGTIRLETNRLNLRLFALDDTEAMFRNWASDDEVTKFLSWPTHSNISITEKIVLGWIDAYNEDDFYHWAIELKNSGEVVGGITVVNKSDQNERCEIGYCIGKDFWGQGITTEALKRVMDFLFNEVGYHRIEALYDTANAASGRVMEKAGMKYEGIRYGYMKNKNGKFVDCETYAKVKAE